MSRLEESFEQGPTAMNVPVRHVMADNALPDLLGGMKRRIGSALTMGADARADYLLNAILGMQRFIIEWEKRNPMTTLQSDAILEDCGTDSAEREAILRRRAKEKP